MWIKAIRCIAVVASMISAGVSKTPGAFAQDHVHPSLVERYLEAAQQGDVHAQVRLALAYYDGTGIAQNYAEAARWFRKAAERGHAGAQLGLGRMYSLGRGFPVNHVEASKWFEKAAEGENDAAQGLIGAAYEEGRGVPQNYAKAAAWYLKAAERGQVSAQFNLGLLYAKGKGVEQNSVAARKWLLRAAQQGHALAQHVIAYSYFHVDQNYAEAHFWANLSAAGAANDEDRREAVRLRDEAASKMTPTEIFASQQRALNWRPLKERVPR